MSGATIAIVPLPWSITLISSTLTGDTLNSAVLLLGSYFLHPSNITSTV